ncbi:hypothetical protein [Williamsia phyllosphaerae]|uniref:hypothetical protein n=1 Tax=Williamsia phyllosphaerae TaxID=885042 RepID=UPI00166C1786|nr:hypothetical protein [Williamsia phyllosphaerae]
MSVTTWIAALRPVDLMSGAAALNPDASTVWTSASNGPVAELGDHAAREYVR